MDACTCANHEARDPPAEGAARSCSASRSRPHPSAYSHATNTHVAGIPVHASLFATDTHAQSCVEMWRVTKPQQLQCASPCYTRRACLLMWNALQLMMQHPVGASLLGLQVAPLFLQCRRNRLAVSSTSWRLLAVGAALLAGEAHHHVHEAAVVLQALHGAALRAGHRQLR